MSSVLNRDPRPEPEGAGRWLVTLRSDEATRVEVRVSAADEYHARQAALKDAYDLCLDPCWCDKVERLP